MITQEQLDTINEIVHEYNKDITYTLNDIVFKNDEWRSDYLNNYTDSLFIYYQQYLKIDRYNNTELYIGIYSDTFSVSSDGELINTELEDYCIIDAKGEYING